MAEDTYDLVAFPAHDDAEEAAVVVAEAAARDDERDVD